MEKINQAAKTKDNKIFGAGLSLLYPSAPPKQTDFSPLVCVGQDLSVEGEFGHIDIASLFLSPSGQVFFVLSDPVSSSQVNSFATSVRSWSCDDLEAIASEFTYRTRGQSYRIIDLMAQHGHLTFSDGPVLSAGIEECMSGGELILLCISYSPTPKS